MRHPTDGALRRLLDEPQAVAALERRHVDDCAPCQARLQHIAADSRAVSVLLAASAATPDTAQALLRLHRRLATTAAQPPSLYERIIGMFELQRSRLAKPLAGLAAAGAVGALVAFTPAGALAQDFLTVFEPTHIVAVPVNSSDFSALPDLASYGTVSAPHHLAAQHFSDAAAAAAAAKLPVLQPATLPKGLPSDAAYQVIPGTSGTFTFSAAKARAAAQARGQALPAMPKNLDGASLQVSTGNALVAVYGAQNLEATRGKGASPRAAVESGDVQALANAVGPVLIIGEMKAPVVTTSGAGVTVGELQRYLLSQPGISPRLADAIRALGDPNSTAPLTTLPIPVPMDQAVWHKVTVQGAEGVAVADNTGIAGGVVWEKGGVIYGVAGPYTERQLLQLADTLQPRG